LCGRLRQHTDDVRRMLSGLDEQTSAAQRVAGKWSLKELLCHLYRTQELFAGRIQSMLSADNPEIENYSPDGDAVFEKLAARPAQDSLADFLAARERFVARLEELGPAEWHRKGRHPEFPHYDVHFQVEYMVHHEAHHVYQMFQRRIPLGKMPH